MPVLQDTKVSLRFEVNVWHRAHSFVRVLPEIRKKNYVLYLCLDSGHTSSRITATPLVSQNHLSKAYLPVTPLYTSLLPPLLRPDSTSPSRPVDRSLRSLGVQRLKGTTELGREGRGVDLQPLHLQRFVLQIRRLRSTGPPPKEELHAGDDEVHFTYGFFKGFPMTSIL